MLKNKTLISLLLFFGLSLHFVCFSQGYEIKVKIKNLKNDTLYLGHHFANPKLLYPDDTLVLKNGTGVFKGKEALPGGMYFIFLPNKSYFDLFLGNDQQFSLENDTSNLLMNFKVEGSTDNEVLNNYQRLLVSKGDEMKAIRALRDSSKAAANKEKYNVQIKKIEEDVKLAHDKLINEHSNEISGVFIKALTEVDVPPAPRDSLGRITDSTFQYKYYRSHYFDNFDFTNPWLLRTPYYEDRVKSYITKVVPQVPDSLFPEIDRLINGSRTTPELFRFMLVTLINEYGKSQIMGMDAVWGYIAEKYYIPEASWADSSSINKMKKQLPKTHYTTVGKQCQNIPLQVIPDEHFLEAVSDTAKKRDPYVGENIPLFSLPADFTILAFWEPDCGHCQKAIPELYRIYQYFHDTLQKNNIQFIAFNILGGREGKVKWVDFVNKNAMFGWINCWWPFDYAYKEKFDIFSTPTVYILDKDKKIIAKRVAVEQIKEILSYELKRNPGQDNVSNGIKH